MSGGAGFLPSAAFWLLTAMATVVHLPLCQTTASGTVLSDTGKYAAGSETCCKRDCMESAETMTVRRVRREEVRRSSLIFYSIAFFPNSDKLGVLHG